MVLVQRSPLPNIINDGSKECLLPAKKQSSSLLLKWDELPEWMRDNQYILGGYRQPAASFKKCLQSLFYLHNESGNILTHLAGAAGFIVLCMGVSQELQAEIPSISWSDMATMYIFLFAAVACMGMSAVFHLVCNHSAEVKVAYNTCDYLGIIIMIVGSCVPMFCYMFYCRPILRLGYLSLMIVLGSVTACMTISPKFGRPEWRPIRATVFVALGLSSAIPAIHASMLFGWEHTMGAAQLPYMVMMGATYIAGAAIYGFRVPERWWPGKFDYWLHSHQVFHVFVVVAATLHYVGMARALRWTYTMGQQGYCDQL